MMKLIGRSSWLRTGSRSGHPREPLRHSASLWKSPERSNHVASLKSVTSTISVSPNAPPSSPSTPCSDNPPSCSDGSCAARPRIRRPSGSCSALDNLERIRHVHAAQDPGSHFRLWIAIQPVVFVFFLRATAHGRRESNASTHSPRQIQPIDPSATTGAASTTEFAVNPCCPTIDRASCVSESQFAVLLLPDSAEIGFARDSSDTCGRRRRFGSSAGPGSAPLPT